MSFRRAVGRLRGFTPLLTAGLALLAFSIYVLMWSISYMERAMVATSLLTGLVGFSLLSASLYLLRLAAYVYGVDAEREKR
ncbi:MAG: hypothetical protein RMI45_00570 [Ignisphaera sp.]|nr:hypothetical protein [Ignisphaera sp.]MDW8084719.1 hypothetical protein [Ignisphaera sp.]